MDEYEYLDQLFNYNDDEINTSNFSAQNDTNGLIPSSMPNFQCNSVQNFQNEYQAITQAEGIEGFDHYVDQNSYSTENHFGNQGTSDVLNYPLPSLATTSLNGLHSPSQVSATTQRSECNGITKPRVRARRGQATDPHSIAERLRREKISDRMKNLQELLPNPNKTDKASMLDEIIEYVKFLQLQVKVLSMSRLGASDPVVPPITDDQTEGSNGLLLSPSSGQISDIVFPSDEVEFERELVKLMESNVTKAVQFLLAKGLCLMPVALTSAMSAKKERETGPNRAANGITEGNNLIVGPHQGSNNVSLSAKDLKPII